MDRQSSNGVFNRLALLHALWRGFLLLTILSIMASVAWAQPDSLWSRTYMGSYGWYYSGVECLEASDGGYLLTIADSPILIKTDSSGDSLWCRYYGYDAGEYYHGNASTCEMSDGGYTLVTNKEIPNDSLGVFLVRLDLLGDSLWTQWFPEPGQYGMRLAGAAATLDNGVVAAGSCHDVSTRVRGAAMKTDASGHRLWRREYGSAYYAALFTKAQQTSDGGYVFAGYANATSSSWTQYWLVKTDSSGNVEWERTFGGAREMICTDVVETSDGGYVMAGSSNNNFLAAWLIKANAQGDSLWSRTFAVDSFAVTRSIRELADGGFAIGASTIPHGRNNLDYWLIRTDANGDTLWTRTFGTSRHDQCSGIVATADGGYVLSGLTEPSPGVYAILLIKTGRDPVLEVAPTFILHPSSLSLSSYPNPFNAVTEIVFDLPHSGNVSLKVFDVLGQEVGVVKEGLMPAGSHQLFFDGKALASGTYVIRLEAGGAAQTHKMLLLK